MLTDSAHDNIKQPWYDGCKCNRAPGCWRDGHARPSWNAKQKYEAARATLNGGEADEGCVNCDHSKGDHVLNGELGSCTVKGLYGKSENCVCFRFYDPTENDDCDCIECFVQKRNETEG